MRPSLFLPLITCAALLLAGCPAALNSLRPGDTPPPAAALPDASSQRPQLPYSLDATNRGAFTEFTIRNEGNSDLPVHPGEMAMLVTETREQIHYDPRKVVIDLPQDCRVAPGQSVTGRIRYLDVSNTVGNRLVFNPGSDPKGRYAVVATIHSPGASSSVSRPSRQISRPAQ